VARREYGQIGIEELYGKRYIHHVTKRFGDVVAVNDLSLDIADKEFIVLVSPSGCGKTTALHCLAGLDEVSEG
jgi:multiple sugar transport system ATP-binding protein